MLAFYHATKQLAVHALPAVRAKNDLIRTSIAVVQVMSTVQEMRALIIASEDRSNRDARSC
jgi:hypothetical protein